MAPAGGRPGGLVADQVRPGHPGRVPGGLPLRHAQEADRRARAVRVDDRRAVRVVVAGLGHNGRPTGEQVIAAVRKARPGLPTGSGLTVKTGPLCAGVWQYTILTVTSSEPLQIMSKGAPASLTIVTAGTDPCSVEVKATAPLALLRTADC